MLRCLYMASTASVRCSWTKSINFVWLLAKQTRCRKNTLYFVCLYRIEVWKWKLYGALCSSIKCISTVIRMWIEYMADDGNNYIRSEENMENWANEEKETIMLFHRIEHCHQSIRHSLSYSLLYNTNYATFPPNCVTAWAICNDHFCYQNKWMLSSAFDSFHFSHCAEPCIQPQEWWHYYTHTHARCTHICITLQSVSIFAFCFDAYIITYVYKYGDYGKWNGIIMNGNNNSSSRSNRGKKP